MDSGVQKGFTLYELLMTVLVASIILGLGVPSLAQFRRNSHMAAAVNDVVSAIHMARSAAVTRQAAVTLCASADPLAPLPSCSADGSVTSGGFFVWLDDDRDTVADPNEEILLQRPGTDGIDIFADSGFVHFGPKGFVDAPAVAGDSARLWVLCDARGNVTAGAGLSAARAVRIPPTGHPSLLTTVSEIGPLPIDCPER
jgi:type IV fimbrial biogenesis protein FimT